MSESATSFGEYIFEEFKNDPFFAPAFKTMYYTVTITSGNIYDGTATTINEFNSGKCYQVNGSSKTKKIKDMDGILHTDVYIKGSLSDLTAPKIGQEVTFDGADYKIVYREIDSVNALFEVFLRA